MKSKRRVKKAAYQRNTQNRYSMYLVFLSVAMLMIVATVSSNSIQNKLDIKRLEYEQNQMLIDQEKEKAKEIEALSKKVQTKEYFEEVAKEKLGLVHPGEILFKAE